MALKVYDPDRVVIVFAAVPLNGFTDGEFIRVTPTAELFATVQGTDGETTRSKTNDRRFRVTVPLMQSSDTNILLSQILELDDQAPNGAGVATLSITDLSGTTKFVSPEAWIAGWPEQSFDRTATSREWVFECAQGKLTVGGN